MDALPLVWLVLSATVGTGAFLFGLMAHDAWIARRRQSEPANDNVIPAAPRRATVPASLRSDALPRAA